MDLLKSAMSGGDGQNKNGNESTSGEGGGGGGFLGGMTDKLNSAAGGGRESEKNEDMLDKGMCVCNSSEKERKKGKKGRPRLFPRFWIGLEGAHHV